MYSAKSIVSFIGPPSVMMSASENALNALIMPMTRLKKTTGVSIGRVIWRKRCVAEAPSSSAAS